MGLRYVIGSAEDQAGSITNYCNKVLETMQSSINSLNSFTQDTELQGKTYDSAKQFVKSVHIPLAKGLIEVCEEVVTQNKKYTSKYRSDVATVTVDEDQVNQHITNIQRQKNNAETFNTVDPSPHSQSMIAIFAEMEKQLKDKIQKLYDYDSETRSNYETVNNLLDSLRRGFQQLADHNPFNPATGTFTTDGMDLSWSEDINGKWNSSKLDDKSFSDLYNDVERLLSGNSSDDMKRVKMILSAYPAAVINKLLKNDEFWTLANELSPGNQTKLINGLVKFDEFGKALSLGKFIPKINTLGKGAEIVSKFGTPIKSLGAFAMTKIPFLSKALGKVGAVATWASLGITFASGGMEDYAKTGSVGKGIIGGAIDSVKSVGPFEGMTVGAEIGSLFGPEGTVIGGAIGGSIGLINTGINFFFPHMYDDVKKGAFKLYDDGKSKINEIGKGVSSTWNSVRNFFNGGVHA